MHPHLQVHLFTGGQVCELWRVVVDVSDQDVNGGCGVETRVTLVCDHHLHSVLSLFLSIQWHPVDDFTWLIETKTNTEFS